MREDCFAYSKKYKNGCSALVGTNNCVNCSFFKTKEEYHKEIKKNENWYQILRNKMISK